MHSIANRVLFSLLLLLSLISAESALPALTCSVNSMNQSQTVTGLVAINTSPTAPFEDLKLSAVNQTAWESYSFEGVSNFGTSGASISFYRNPSLATQGNGAVWVQVYAVWENGTQWGATLWQNQSVIVGCDLGDDAASYGFWSDFTDNTEFSFEIPRTLSSASLRVFGPSIDGSWNMTSIAPPMTVNATGIANPHGSVQLAPMAYWIEPIPMAKLNASIKIAGTQFDLEGFGGHWRNWAPYDWNSLAKSWYRLRATVGPYTVIYWTFTSALDGQVYTNGILMQNGTNVFGQNVTPRSKSEAKSATFWLSYSGKVHGSYEDNSTGVTVQFIGNGKEWRFVFTHTNILSESPLGAAEAYTSFVNIVNGGEVGGPPFDGVGTSDQAAVQIPVSI